jgi:CRISPR/Cas system-associated exonuclease Cas4 (RecB family)
MPIRDPYSATWVSHSSISMYLKCPKAYYYGSVYKNPRTGNRIGIVQPPLSLGQAVHEVLESLSQLPTEERLKGSLLDRFSLSWAKVTGQLGGFSTPEEESTYKNRGVEMLSRVQINPSVIGKKAVKIKQNGFIPHYLLSEEDNVILCGKVDWLEYLEDSDSVHIVDFKTGKHDEDANSLQLPIYHLLTANLQKRKAAKASYWYLDRDTEPKEVPLPELEEARDKVLKVAKRIKLARELKAFKCPKETCRYCRPFEAVLRGDAIYVGESDSKQDMYVIPQKVGDNFVQVTSSEEVDSPDSVIL